MSCEDQFARSLRQRGYRLTAQRKAILAALHEAHGLVSAEDLHVMVAPRVASADLSTVYRTLDLLQEVALVGCVRLESGEHRYELLGTHGPHLHLVCRRCGQVIGAPAALARGLADALAAECGFSADVESLSIPGLCAACAGEVNPPAAGPAG